MKNLSKIISLLIVLVTIDSCNSYKKEAFFACNQSNLLDNYDRYKINREKSIQLFANSEIEFAMCDQKFADAFKETEKKAFIASLDRANRSLINCKEDMNRDNDFNAPWFANIEADKMIVDYRKYKNLYPAIPNFDINALNKCFDYYKNFAENQERKKMIMEHKEANLLKKYDYKSVWSDKGLSGIIDAVDNGKINISSAKQYLIRKDNLLFDPDFVVDDVLGNVIVYRNLYNKDVKMILQRYKDESYARKSNLNGSYFVIIGTQSLKVDDKATDILVFKKIL